MHFKHLILTILLIININNVRSTSLIERSYEYVMSLSKSYAPTLLSVLDCFAEDNAWACAKDRAAKILDKWEEENNQQRRSWGVDADAEVLSTGRSNSELPSKVGTEVENSLNSLADIVQHSVANASSRHHESGGGIDTITISTSADKKKDKKKKTKPPKIHLIQSPMMGHHQQEMSKGRSFQQAGKSPIQSWVIGVMDRSKDVEESEVRASQEVADRKGRGLLEDAWAMGGKAVDALAEHVIDNEDADNGLESDKSSLEEQRGKKKKKKKAILKLLILGAVLKAKIGTLLQILSFKLQVKFFLIALIGLGINLARFWLDLKKSHQQPQKVIYYEHAQHQHHYDHEEDHGWGPWSRSILPEEDETEVSVNNSPYNAYIRAAPTRV